MVARAMRNSIMSAIPAAAMLAVMGNPALAVGANPLFSPDGETGWIAQGSNFLPPPSGPGPVLNDPAHPYQGNADGRQSTFRVADTNNPVLQPWVVEALKKANERALSGKAAFTPKERCWPIGVPGYDLYPVFPIYFLQAPNEVVMVWTEDHQIRHIYLDRPHSANVKPSWFGESVGHYEGDTLVVDTMGLSAKTYLDNFLTPHTEKLHVVERFHMVEGGRTLQADLRIEDDGAFTQPFNAVQRFRRAEKTPMTEASCAENNENWFGYAVEPIPEAKTPDF